ncbi:hypothetical protein [Alteromonas lipotrueae]|uniref:hypothetical protein n=1 Tax=Alteromonas lipotrueae TaxID=2803814 RepID=UPI001C438F15|nr:hypothetical protein [Alteromonas lipotrueae]
MKRQVLTDLRYLILIAGLLTASQGFAHGVVEGYVIDVRVERNGKVLLTFDRDVGHNPPNCSASSRRNMAFNLSTVADSGMLSAALTAQSTHKILRARGSGACESWGGIENIFYVVVRDS